MATQIGPGRSMPVSWRLHREVILVAGWGRAILLQLAHPLVAQGVAEHSGFLAEAGRVTRLRRTVDAMLALTFGPPDDAARVARRINAIHDRVHGTLAVPRGAFPAGHAYSAHDPALLTWVHATLVESSLLTYELLVAPLADAERDRYCLESSGIETALGIPNGSVPRDEAALRSYLSRMRSSGDIRVTDTARRLAAAVIAPPAPRPARPLFALGRLLTAGLLPPEIRDAYGLPWSPARQRMLGLGAATVRRGLPVVPSPLRYWARARRACRGVEAVARGVPAA
jgi:uncharacterized protein (DUF2236 family)